MSPLAEAGLRSRISGLSPRPVSAAGRTETLRTSRNAVKIINQEVRGEMRGCSRGGIIGSILV